MHFMKAVQVFMTGSRELGQEADAVAAEYPHFWIWMYRSRRAAEAKAE